MQVVVKALSVNLAVIYKRLENKTSAFAISMDFVWIRLLTGFSLKNRSLLENPRGVRHFTKPQIFCPSPTQALIFLETHNARKIITSYAITFFSLLLCISFCAKSYYILRYYDILRYYYILWQKLKHFALLLHFVANVITFCATITFCGKRYYILRYY